MPDLKISKFGKICLYVKSNKRGSALLKMGTNLELISHIRDVCCLLAYDYNDVHSQILFYNFNTIKLKRGIKKGTHETHY